MAYGISGKPITQEDLDKLQEACKCLDDLLKDRHEGLHVWWVYLEKKIVKVRDACIEMIGKE